MRPTKIPDLHSSAGANKTLAFIAHFGNWPWLVLKRNIVSKPLGAEFICLIWFCFRQWSSLWPDLHLDALSKQSSRSLAGLQAASGVSQRGHLEGFVTTDWVQQQFLPRGMLSQIFLSSGNLAKCFLFFSSIHHSNSRNRELQQV